MKRVLQPSLAWLLVADIGFGSFATNPIFLKNYEISPIQTDQVVERVSKRDSKLARKIAEGISRFKNWSTRSDVTIIETGFFYQESDLSFRFVNFYGYIKGNDKKSIQTMSSVLTEACREQVYSIDRKKFEQAADAIGFNRKFRYEELCQEVIFVPTNNIPYGLDRQISAKIKAGYDHGVFEERFAKQTVTKEEQEQISSLMKKYKEKNFLEKSLDAALITTAGIAGFSLVSAILNPSRQFDSVGDIPFDPVPSTGDGILNNLHLSAVEIIAENFNGTASIVASGNVIDKEAGLITTNSHVWNLAELSTTKNIYVRYANGDTQVVDQIAWNPNYNVRKGDDKPIDLAILTPVFGEIPEGIEEIQGVMRNPIAGEEYWMVGNPGGIQRYTSDGMIGKTDFSNKNQFADVKFRSENEAIFSGNSYLGSSGSAMVSKEDGALIGVHHRGYLTLDYKFSAGGEGIKKYFQENEGPILISLEKKYGTEEALERYSAFAEEKGVPLGEVYEGAVEAFANGVGIRQLLLGETSNEVNTLRSERGDSFSGSYLGESDFGEKSAQELSDFLDSVENENGAEDALKYLKDSLGDEGNLLSELEMERIESLVVEGASVSEALSAVAKPDWNITLIKINLDKKIYNEISELFDLDADDNGNEGALLVELGDRIGLEAAVAYYEDYAEKQGFDTGEAFELASIAASKGFSVEILETVLNDQNSTDLDNPLSIENEDSSSLDDGMDDQTVIDTF